MQFICSNEIQLNRIQILASDGHTTSTQIENPMFSLQILFYSFFSSFLWLLSFYTQFSLNECMYMFDLLKLRYAHRVNTYSRICVLLLSFAFGHLFYGHSIQLYYMMCIGYRLQATTHRHDIQLSSTKIYSSCRQSDIENSICII